MTIRLIEGFENTTDAVCMARKWSQFTGISAFSTGRLLGQSAQSSLTTWRTTSLGLQDTWTVGFALQHSNATVTDRTDVFPLIIRRGTAEQLSLHWRQGTGNTFHFEIRRGTTLLTTTSDFVAQSWHYFEFQFTIDPVNGAYEFRHNTQVDVSDSGPVNTADDGVAGADVFEIRIVSTTPSLRFDDIYILDDQGTINNDFLGDSVIEGRRPTGDGTPQDWTLQTGQGLTTHWEALDALTCSNPDTLNFIFSTTVGHQDLLSFSPLSFITGQIHCVQLMSDTSLDVTGSREFRHIIRSGGTLFPTPAGGITHTVASTTPQTFWDVFELDPDTALRWTISGVNSADFGVEVVS